MDVFDDKKVVEFYRTWKDELEQEIIRLNNETNEQCKLLEIQEMKYFCKKLVLCEAKKDIEIEALINEMKEENKSLEDQNIELKLKVQSLKGKNDVKIRALKSIIESIEHRIKVEERQMLNEN